MWLWSVFTWHQGGHGVPKQYNGGYVGVPNPISSPEPLLPRYGMRNPVGVKLGVSYVNAFFCTDAGHESETLSFSFFLGIQNLLSLKMIHARPRVVDKLWQQVCSLDFITLKTFFRYFFRLTTPITQIYHWNCFLDLSPYFNELIFSCFKTELRPQTKIGCLYSQ